VGMKKLSIAAYYETGDEAEWGASHGIRWLLLSGPMGRHDPYTRCYGTNEQADITRYIKRYMSKYDILVFDCIENTTMGYMHWDKHPEHRADGIIYLGEDDD